MRIHEFQAKRLLSEFGIPIPFSRVASTVPDAVAAAQELGLPVVVKAQIHAGGRGKAGGIVLARDEKSVHDAAVRLLGRPLVTSQTGPEGLVVRSILVEKTVAIEDEIYLAITIDRSSAAIVVIASRAGGVDIEKTADVRPGEILRESVDPAIGLRPFQASRLARGLDLPADAVRRASELILSLHRLFRSKDCTLAEINPLAVTTEGDLVAVDAKLSFDDSGLYRHPEIAALRDEGDEDPLEAEAISAGLNYIKLDGNVGCLVNGAGLAMATMDLIEQVGARPANFLDVGGGATAEMVERGFRILVGDPNVEAVLINVFGGILRCDTLAEGVVAAARAVDVTVPVIVRLEGTNVEKGREILEASGLSFRPAASLREAATMVADAVGI
ncbi:MAG: ADP-forming succinate--CoA ligase subunit beta [Candidatus Bipolaricaulia bacterium]